MKPPKLYDGKRYVRHALEEQFGACAWDILSAIQRGFRAQVDVKGKLAEYFLFRQLEALERKGVIEGVEWRDKDGVPDFLLRVRGADLEMECKNVRSGDEVFENAFKVEIQKTRNKIGGGPSRGYRVDEFQILAACLFNQTGKWKYLFAATKDLECRPDWPDFLTIFQRVPHTAEGAWKLRVEEVVDRLAP